MPASDETAVSEAVVVENQSVMGNMSLSSTSVPAPAVECIDLTKETSAETSNTRQIWRMRHKQRDAQRAQLTGGSQPGSSSAPAAMSSPHSMRTRSQSTSSAGSIVIVDEVNIDTSVVVVDTPVKPAIPERPKRGKKRATEEEAPVETKKPDPPRPASPVAAYKCPICLDSNIELKLNNVGLIVLSCGHIICKPCYTAMKGVKECPVCRKTIKKGGTHPIYL